MSILDDFQIEITPQVLIEVHERVWRQEKTLSIDAAKKICAGAKPLLTPHAAIGFFACSEIAETKEQVTLRSEDDRKRTLFIGPKVRHMKQAQEAATVVYTVGSEIGRQIDHLKEAGDELQACHLSTYAIFAMECVSQQVRHFLERYATGKNCGVSPALKPGSLKGWPLAGQGDLFRLAEAQRIGISCENSGLLSPLYSGSFLVGIGKDYPNQKIKSLCGECGLFESCAWRSEE